MENFDMFPMGAVWESYSESERLPFKNMAYARLTVYGIASAEDLDTPAKQMAFAAYVRYIVDSAGVISEEGPPNPPPFVIDSLTQDTEDAASLGPVPIGFTGSPATPSQSGTQSGSGPGVDQTARDAARRALEAAEAAQDTANRAEGDAEANAQDIDTNALAIRGKQDKLMPPSNAEADAATATAIRGWTAALIRRVVESIVPQWARNINPPDEATPLLLESAYVSGTVALVRNSWVTVGTITIPKDKLSGKIAILFDATADRTSGAGTLSVRVMRGTTNVRTATDEVEVSGQAEHEQIVVLATDTPPETEDAVYTIQVNHNSANLVGTVHAREIIVLGGGVAGSGGGGLTEEQVRKIATTIAQTAANDAANAAVSNGVQIPARAAPGNEISGVQQYFGADFYAPDAEHGQRLTAHRNGSTFWETPVTQDDIDAGDVWTAYPTNNATSLATNLRQHADRSVSKAAGLIVITADFTTVTRSYEDGDRYYIAPHQDTEAFMVLVSKAGGGGTGTGTGVNLSTAQRVALLDLIPDPASITFPDVATLEALVADITIAIPNPEILTGDVWVEGEIQGQPALARQKWTTATASLRLQINASTSRSVASGIIDEPQLEVRLRFFDASSAGNEIERLGVNIPLVRLQLPKPTTPDRGKVASVNAAGDGYDLQTPSANTLTVAERVDLLNVHLNPAVMTFTESTQLEAHLRQILITVENREISLGDIWIEIAVSGVKGTVVAGPTPGVRVKWDPDNGGVRAVRFSEAEAKRIADSAVMQGDSQLLLTFRFFEMESGGLSVEFFTVTIPLVHLQLPTPVAADAGKLAAVNKDGDGYELTAPLGFKTEAIGSGDFTITATQTFATKANSADITIPSDGDWGLISFGRRIRGAGAREGGEYHWVNLNELRALTAVSYGDGISSAGLWFLDINGTGGADTFIIGRTSANKLLVATHQGAPVFDLQFLKVA